MNTGSARARAIAWQCAVAVVVVAAGGVSFAQTTQVLCPCTAPRNPPGPAKKKTPPPPAPCGADRNCTDRAGDEAAMLEAAANRQAGRWDDAARKYLEVLKRPVDAKTREAATAGYLEASAKAFSSPKEDEVRLLAADTERQLQHWDVAATKYLEALQKASDERRQTQARSGYNAAASVITGRWWRWSRYFPPLWWLHGHPILAFIIAFAVVLIVLAPLWISRGPLARLPDIVPPILRPRFTGRARVLATTTLTDDAPGKLFAAQLPYSALEVRRRWDRVNNSFMSGTTTLLSVPSALAQQIATQMPEIKGINVGSIAAFFLLIGQYFSWRVESQVGYSPDAPDTKGPGRLRAYATLRWAWFTRGSYAVSPRVRHAADFERAAYAVAARVLGAAQPRNLR